jgi:Zn-dependent peptidase ImmA (M78 family)
VARRYLHGDESDSIIASTYTDLADATSFIIKRARALIAQLIELRQREEPPFLAKELAPLLGVGNVIHADLGEEDGMLLRLTNGYVIQVNANHHDVRQNFSCAHEIGHIILDEFMQERSSSRIDFRRQAGEIERAKERLCNIAAAELLMPGPVFSKYLAGLGLSIDSVERLARIFKVSVPASAIRVKEISKERCLVIRWKRWQKSKSKGFIQDWTGEPARRTYVRDPSALLKAYESDDTVKSFKRFDIDNISKRCLMESKGFGHEKNRYVLSLIFPDR